MLIITGKVINISNKDPLKNYEILASLNYILESDGLETNDNKSIISTSVGARSDQNGAFSIVLELSGQPIDPVNIRVSSPDGQVVKEQQLKLASLTRKLTLRVTAIDANNIVESDVPGLGERLRIDGRVIDPSGAQVAANIPVVLWGRMDTSNEESDEALPLLITSTQIGGIFSGDWPNIRLKEAFGRVNGGQPTQVPLNEASQIVRKVILVTSVESFKESVCDCDQPTPRIPEQADLTGNPKAFSQDLGGGCTDLSTPNRVLEEFTYSYVVRTSQPRVKSLTLNVKPIVSKDLLIDLLGVSVSSLALRGEHINAKNFDLAGLEMDVDTALHLVRGNTPPRPDTITRAAWLSDVSRTKALISSVLKKKSTRTPLDAEMAIDWDDTPTIHQSTEIAFGHILRYKEIWRADGYSLGDLLYSLPLAPGQRRRVAVVDWERRSSSSRAEQLEFEESLDAVIQRDRDVQEIVGSELHENTSAGSSNTTWGVAGGIGAGYISSGFGIFGGAAGGASGSDSTSWQRSSRRFSADSMQNLRDRVGQRASSVRSQRSTVVQTVAQGETLRAESEVVANYNRCHAVTMEYFEVLRHFLVTHELSEVNECLFVPFPMTQFNRGKALRWRSTLSRFLKDRRLRRAFDAIERVADDWDGWDYPVSRFSEEEPHTIEGELRISFILPRPRDDKDGKFQRDEWLSYAKFLPFFPQQVYHNVIEAASEINKDQQAARDDAFRRDIAPQIATNLVNSLNFSFVGSDGGETRIPVDGTLVSRYRENRGLYVSLQPAGDLPSVPREDIVYFKVEYDGEALPQDAKIIVQSGKVRYRTNHITALLFNDRRILNDISIGDSVIIPTPVSRRELRNPHEQDRQRADKLIDHLNDHIEYYHQAIWHNLDAQRRFMLMDAIRVPGQDGKSVASLCNNELIGIVGNSLVLGVSPGQRLDPTIDRVDNSGKPVDIKNAYAIPPSPPLRLSVPTRGVYAEAISGHCNACEMIDDNLYWRWSTDKLLAPPEIAGPVSTASRANDESNLTPTALPGPLVNIQNAPEIPDPFGLSNAFALLAKPDLFRDITGLEGSQKNAIAAFDSALSAASAIGGEAATLARQQELSKNADRLIDSIAQAVDDDLLTRQQGRDLTESVLKGLSGKAEPDSNAPTKDEAVKKALDKAAQADSAKVKISSAGETVEASFSGDSVVIGGASVAEFFEPPGSFQLTSVNVMTERHPGNDLTPTVSKTLAELKANIGQSAIDDFKALNVLQEKLPGYTLLRKLLIAYPADPKSTKTVEGSGRLPIVVIAHGNHRVLNGAGAFVKNHEGYRYLQAHLADAGIVSISVDMNTCALFGSFVEMRAKLILDALDSLRKMDKKGSASRFEGRLDFDNVVLVGHSRGGEAVCRAAVLNAKEADPYGIKGVCSIAPMDMTGNHLNTFGDTSLTSKHTPFYLVLYGALDGDVGGWGGARSAAGTGFRLYDRATCDKSMVFIDKANHNRFNDIWMDDKDFAGKQTDDFGMDPDDIAGRLLSRASHRELAKEYVIALCQWQQQGKSAERFLLDNRRKNKAGAAVSVQWSFGSSVQNIDDLHSLSINSSLNNAVIEELWKVNKTPPAGGTIEPETNQVISLLSVEKPGVTGPFLPAVEIALSVPLVLLGPPADWSSFDLLTFRVSAEMDVSADVAIQAAVLPQFSITIVDSAGAVESFNSLAIGPVLNPLSDHISYPVFHQGFMTPVANINSSTSALKGVIKTVRAHGFTTGDEVLIRNHTGSTPSINGKHVITRISADKFSIPLTITADGSGGIVLKAENLSVIRMETVSIPILPLRFSGLNLSDIKSISITPNAGYPKKMFFDSLQLVKV